LVSLSSHNEVDLGHSTPGLLDLSHLLVEYSLGLPFESSKRSITQLPGFWELVGGWMIRATHGDDV
jgi:hypothetical protein